MHLELQRCTIRSWQPADAQALVKYANNRRIWRNMRDQFPHPYTLAHARDWIASARSASPETQFVLEAAGEPIGAVGVYLGLDVYRLSGEIGYWVAEPYWGQGIATEAVIAMTEYAFAHYRLVRLFAGVFDWNPASERVLQKAGYQLEGRLRKHVTKAGHTLDELIYAKLHEAE